MKALWWIIGILVIVGGAWWLMKGPTDNSYSASPSPTVYVSESPVASGSPQSSGATSGVGPSGTAKNAAYDTLIAQYGTNRIQFDAGCQAIPKTAVFRAGTKVMFDNRSGDARTIVINGVSYKFPGYGYWIIPMNSTTLPKTFMIDCGSGQNTGTVTIEK